MDKFLEICYVMLTGNSVMEMANLQPKTTGLAATIHVCSKGGAKHSARVKVSNVLGSFSSSDNFSVVISTGMVVGKCKLTKDQLKAVRNWIEKNKVALFHVWEQGHELDLSDMQNMFTKV